MNQALACFLINRSIEYTISLIFSEKEAIKSLDET